MKKIAIKKKMIVNNVKLIFFMKISKKGWRKLKKKKKVKLVKFANELFKDIDECVAVDPTVKEVFMVSIVFV